MAGLILIVLIVGLCLPRGHVETKSRAFSCPPEQLWSRVTSFERWQDWHPDLERIEIVRGGAGVGTRVRQVYKSWGPMLFEVVTWEPRHRFEIKIADPDLPVQGSWTFEIASENGGSKLTLTERGEVPNPFMRAMSLPFRLHKSSVDKFLEALTASYR